MSDFYHIFLFFIRSWDHIFNGFVVFLLYKWNSFNDFPIFALASVAQLLDVVPCTERLKVQFLVRALTWGECRRQPMDVSLPLFSLSKSIKKLKKIIIPMFFLILMLLPVFYFKNIVDVNVLYIVYVYILVILLKSNL